MRRILAGLLLLLCFPLCALGQAKGEVESIGFGSLYRPNVHVPMLVRVQAERSGTYQIRVVQKDLDQDHEIFKQDVSLTGSDDGRGPEQRFWMYFIPQPTDNGLPDTSRGGTLRDLQKDLKVFLCDERGRQLIQLPVTQTITNIENVQAGPFSAPRGVKMVLAISDGAQQPVWRDYQQAIGTMEDIVFVTVRSMDLPEDVRGYEMVDAIVWLAAPLPDPSKPSDEKRYNAIQSYVRGGGHLVVCQPAQRDATASVAELLPVEVKEVAPRDNLEPLRGLATAQRDRWDQALRREAEAGDPFSGTNRRRDDWALPQGPFMFARAVPKPGAVVEMAIGWNADGTDQSPYLARIGHGFGCVTWVAHDLSDPAITGRAKSGWPYVWDKVLDFNHDLLVIDNQTPEQFKNTYRAGSAVDIGHSLLAGLELKSKGQMLVSIAVVFFIAYWVVAGPGVYLYLLTRSRAQLSWFFFAFSALVATVLTVLVVKLVVRGPPEMNHVTLVRGTTGGGEPAVAISQFGLYIPRDGAQTLTLPEVSPKHVSYLVAYPRHPQHAPGDIEFPAQLPYVIPVRDGMEDGPVEIAPPFRSTLKQFSARRVGPAAGTVSGKARLSFEDDVWRFEGQVNNGTGQRLRNVYFAYYSPRDNDDYILFLPAWEKGQTVELAEFHDRAVKFIVPSQRQEDLTNLSGRPEQKFRLRGPMGKAGSGMGWSSYWFSLLRSSSFANATRDDLPTSEQQIYHSFAMMSLFDRLPPMKNRTGFNADRVEVLRRGGRYLSVGKAISAGRLVVIAEGERDAPLPFPLLVNGDPVAGKGTVLFQFDLPIERVGAAATTLPSTRPATAPGAEAEPTAPVSVEQAFDPQKYLTGPLPNTLTPEQRRMATEARRAATRARQQQQQQLRQQQQQQQRQRLQQQQQQQPTPQTAPGEPGAFSPVPSPVTPNATASARGFGPEAATWPQ